MTLRIRRLFFALLLVTLAAGGCSSSSDRATDDEASDQITDVPDEDDTNEDGSSIEPEATSIPLPEDDSAADAAIAGLDGDPTPEPATADRATTAQGFVRSRFNIDPDPEWVRCMVAETERDDALDLALRTPSVALGEVDDTEMRSLTLAMNGCIATISLADWATQAIGPQGEVQQTAPPCLVERFDDPADGDIVFYNFVALTYQFRLDPLGIDSLVDALSTCAPITSLSDFFASQAEQATNFETEIDRECLNDLLSPANVSEEFWGFFVDGSKPPVEVITPYTDACALSLSSNLADIVPADFVAWSGTGALARVKPAARAGVYDAPPPMTIDPAASYEAVIATGGGEVRIRLFADTAPITVNSFVNLARDGYFEDTVFHRVLAGFMAQAGDPTGTGTGGPGYQYQDEVDDGPALDRKGLLAMANTGPATNGSQFFITLAPTDWLTGVHTVFGEVIEGIEIVDAIELRDPDAPTGRGQAIESVTIIEG